MKSNDVECEDDEEDVDMTEYAEGESYEDDIGGEG